MSRRAFEVLKSCDTVAGYGTYIDLIRSLLDGKEIIETAMKKEVDRVKAAIDAALAGKICAVVSSGDAGIYAMAGLIFEVLKERGVHVVRPRDPSARQEGRPALVVEVVPGIPALASGASLLGAPLTHDFAAISLSDLLTPWETIEKRLECAAMADFVIVLYNPRSKKRSWQLEKAQSIILKHRSGETPVGIVQNAMRDGETVRILPLRDLHLAEVDMLTTVFIGNSSSMTYMDFLITPRGYRTKYQIG
jgi:precorrin-3B C17-methyltransferase